MISYIENLYSKPLGIQLNLIEKQLDSIMNFNQNRLITKEDKFEYIETIEMVLKLKRCIVKDIDKIKNSFSDN